MPLKEADLRFIMKTAREAITRFVADSRDIEFPKDFPEALKEKRGVFVTLTKNGNLRGCVGFPYSLEPIIRAVVTASCLACEDQRFPPVRKEELDYIKIEVSILSEPRKISDFEDITTDDGLIIKHEGSTGLLLPQVWKEIPSKTEFLECLCRKAGLSPGEWKDGSCELYRFSAESVEE